MRTACAAATLEVVPAALWLGGTVNRGQEDAVKDVADSARPFIPGVYEVVHPLGSLQFVMLPATGRYVPSSHWRPEVAVHGQDYWCTISAPDGQIVATGVGSGHALPSVEVTAAGKEFADECARMPSLGVCVPGLGAETVTQHLVAEELLSRWCRHQSARALVWASVEGGEQGKWQFEPALSSSVARDVAVLCDSRTDAAWVWADGTRVQARSQDERLQHVDRVDKTVWPTWPTRDNDVGPNAGRWR